jgi:hypothetical protein
LHRLVLSSLPDAAATRSTDLLLLLLLPIDVATAVNSAADSDVHDARCRTEDDACAVAAAVAAAVPPAAESPISRLIVILQVDCYVSVIG